VEEVEGITMAALITPAPPALRSEDTESRFAIRLVEPRVRILSVSASPADHAALRRIIDASGWRFATADTCGEAIREYCRNRARVVFCERSLPDGEWKDILERISGLGDPPRFAVISRLADERLWFEVLDLGGYDVLSKPLVEEEVRNVLRPVPAQRAHPIRRTRLSVVRTRSGA
jgi:DNA-binding response OmpR family regulator